MASRSRLRFNDTDIINQVAQQTSTPARSNIQTSSTDHSIRSTPNGKILCYAKYCALF